MALFVLRGNMGFGEWLRSDMEMRVTESIKRVGMRSVISDT